MTVTGQVTLDKSSADTRAFSLRVAWTGGQGQGTFSPWPQTSGCAPDPRFTDEEHDWGLGLEIATV